MNVESRKKAIAGKSKAERRVENACILEITPRLQGVM